MPLLMGAAVPRDPAIVALHAMDLRVASIGYRLAIENAALCTPGRPQAGLLLHSLGQYGASARKAVQDGWGLTAAPTVQAVVPGSPAERAGLYEGDRIISINGTPAPSALGKRSSFDVIDATHKMLEAALIAGPADLTLARASGKITRLTPARGCPGIFQVLPSTKMKATADGRYVQLSTTIVESTRDDDELAFIIAHELAHNALGHKERLDKIGRKAANVRETEIAADVLGVKLMHGAGFDPYAAARYWAREGDRMDAGLFRAGTHLSPGKRVDLLRTTATAGRLSEQ